MSGTFWTTSVLDEVQNARQCMRLRVRLGACACVVTVCETLELD